MNAFCCGRLGLPLLLILALLAAPALAQDNQTDDARATALQQKLLGEWTFDIDRMIAQPEFQAQPEEQRAAMENQLRMMMGQLRIRFSEETLIIGTPAGEQTAAYAIGKLVAANQLQLTVTNPDNGREEQVHVVVDGDRIELWNPAQGERRSYFLRDGADGADGDGDEPEPTQPAQPAPPSMNDPPPAEQNARRVKKLVLGEWTIDIERSVRENPDNQGLSEEELQAQIEQGRLMAGMVTIEITEQAMTIAMGEMRIESPWKILSVDGNVLEAEVDANGEVRRQKVEVINEDTLRMHVQGQMLIVIRKGATPDVGPGPETAPPAVTGPRPDGLHGLMVGEWQVDLAKTLRADPAMANMSDEDFAATLEFAKMTAGEMKVLVYNDRMDVYRMGSKETYRYRVVSVDGNKAKLSLTGPTGTEREAIFTVGATEMNGAIGGRPMFLTRESAPQATDQSATPSSGPADAIRGVWVVDIDATLANDPRFKDLSEERKQMIAQGLAGMLGLLTWTVTDQRFIEDSPAGKRDYAWRVVSVDGSKLTIEMSDDAGNKAQTTLEVNGNSMSGDIHGSMRYLKRKP